jgi:hypothetical protein
MSYLVYVLFDSLSFINETYLKSMQVKYFMPFNKKIIYFRFF